MAAASPTDIVRGDLLQALDFAQHGFNRWYESGLLRDAPHRAVVAHYDNLRENLKNGAPIPSGLQLPSPEVCWSCKRMVAADEQYCEACGAAAHTAETNKLRYLVFVCFELKRLFADVNMQLAELDGCLADANARIAALRRKLDGERIPMVEAASQAIKPEGKVQTFPTGEMPVPPRQDRGTRQDSETGVSPVGRRNILEILLDPRSIQWLLASGAALLVLGLVIWLAAEGYFAKPLFLAVCMGIANIALLASGWAVIRFTRYQMAGRAVTLLACLLLPLNLWFYHAQWLIRATAPGNHLWMAALVCCALYAVSARLLRDPMFVCVLVGGVTLTGLLILADNQFQVFWEIAAPSTLLIVLGLVCIHAERVFPEGDGDFSRRRFGLAFFWSGHAVLGGGLLLLLAAQIAGDWLFELFQPIYAMYEAGPSPIVTAYSGKLTALCLVLAGLYAYAYSDLVVRRLGVYLSLAVFALLWAEVLLLNLVPLDHKLEVFLIALAITGLVGNMALTQTTFRESPLRRAGPPLGLCLCVVPVVLGVLLHSRATNAALKEFWPYTLTWIYIAAMLTAALSCRVSAYLYRHTRPRLSLTYFLGTAAATMVGAAGLLKVVRPEMAWQGQAPLLMLIPLLYLLAARLYQGHTPEKPLLWAAHAAVEVMLISSVGAAFNGFLLISGDSLNLALAAFFAEATLFYLAEALWRKHVVSVYACTVVACAAVWQLLKYGGFAEEYYILTFAVVGLLMLVAYRFAVLENMNLGGMARAAFRSGSALLSLAFVGGALLVLGHLLGGNGDKGVLVSLLAALIVLALLAAALVRQAAWRRWYLSAAVGNAALTILVLAVLGQLTVPQKLEIACVAIGLLLLIAGHLGWYREQEGQSDEVTLSLFLGSLLVALPLAYAVLYCRAVRPAFDTFHTLNELAMLTLGLLLLASGFMFRLKSTTLSGAFLSALYLVSLLLFLRVPEKLQTTAVYIMAGGGVFFASGLLLSLYRDHLLTLPDRVKRREGVFRVLTWR